MPGHSPNAGRDVNLKRNIPKLYRAQFFEAALFGFMVASGFYDEDGSQEGHARDFLIYFHISEEDYPITTLKTQFTRMLQKLQDIDKMERASDILDDPDKLEIIMEIKRIMDNPENIRIEVIKKLDILLNKTKTF